MVNNPSGCAFGKVSREKIDNLKESFDSGFTKVDKKLDALDIRMTELFNHNSKKLHPVAVIIITILASLCTGLIVKAVYG